MSPGLWRCSGHPGLFVLVIIKQTGVKTKLKKTEVFQEGQKPQCAVAPRIKINHSLKAL